MTGPKRTRCGTASGIVVIRNIERNQSAGGAFRGSTGFGVASVMVLSDLPPKQRIERYRALGHDARRQASACNGAMRESYLLMAHHWEILARAVEGSAPAMELSERNE